MNAPTTVAPLTALTDDINARFESLFAALRNSDLIAIRALVNRGRNDLLAVQLSNGCEALHVAANFGKPAIVQHLIDCGADLTALVDGGNGTWLTPLDVARTKGHGEAVEVLIAACEAQGVRNGESRQIIAVKAPDNSTVVRVLNRHTGERLTDRFSRDAAEEGRKAAMRV